MNDQIWRGAIGALLWLVLPGLALAADDPAADACHQKDTTVAIMDCLNGLTAQWDKRLNAGYQAALKASESAARRDGLSTRKGLGSPSGRQTAAGMTHRKARSGKSPEPTACWT